MSNRTDFDVLAQELGADYDLPAEAVQRIEDELHNAYVAGQEGEAAGNPASSGPIPRPASFDRAVGKFG